MAELKRIAKADNAIVGHVNEAFYDLHPHVAPISNGVDVNPKTDINCQQPDKDSTPGNGDGMSRLQIIKNLLVLSFGFTLLFTSFGSMSNLQSSVNQSLGTLSQSIIYVALVGSSMFVPSIFISLLGEKQAVAVSMLMYSVYIVANFYPISYTLIPASVLLGLGAAPLWTAKASYLTTIATRYAAHIGQPTEIYVVRFFGIFFMMFQTSQIWGNLISSKILANADDSNNLSLPCGVSFFEECFPPEANGTVHTIPQNFRRLCGVYTGCALLAAVVVFVLLDPLDKQGSRKVQKPSFTTLVVTLRHLRNPYQLLLVPITVFSGLAQAYFQGDFTKAFVTCGWGVSHVGYVMICFGVTNAMCSLALGIKTNALGRIAINLFGGTVTGAMIVLMFLWVPTSDNRIIYFVISGLWGVGDAIWATYTNAFYGVLFPNDKEAAFSNFRLWQSVGYIAAFAYSSCLHMTIKLAILAAFLVVGYLTYLAIEIHFHLTKSDRNISDTNKRTL